MMRRQETIAVKKALVEAGIKSRVQQIVGTHRQFIFVTVDCNRDEAIAIVMEVTKRRREDIQVFGGRTM